MRYLIGRVCLISLIPLGFSLADAREPGGKFLEDYCLDCHDADTRKGDLRLDDLDHNYTHPETFEKWEKVLARVSAGEMPPPNRRQPTPRERGELVDLFTPMLIRADAERVAREGRVVYRRLNREEYQNTVRDLLGIDAELKDYLPEDGQAHGFDNVGKALNISSVLMERYLEAADVALDAAIARFKPPATKARRFSPLDDQRLVNNKNIFLPKKDGLVFFSSGYSPTGVRAFRAPVAGQYRFRIATTPYQADEPVTFRVYGGMVNSRDGKTELIGYYDVPPGGKHITEIEHRLPKDGSIRPVPYRTAPDIYQVKAANYKGAGLLVHWIEIEGPLDNEWPPESHTRLFGDIPLKEIELDPRQRRRRRGPPEFELVPKHPRQDAEAVIRRFVGKAFRRPITEADVQPYLALVNDRLDRGYPFVEAVRVGLKAILCAPDFIFFREQPGELDDHALAARLAYFLWSTTPDQPLWDLAAAGRLKNEGVLRGQVTRMLQDKRAGVFTRNFVGQWLDLREIEFTTPDRILYPEFDELLQVSMVRETELFFDEILRHDRSALNFLHSDFTLLNERLAEHYGVGGVRGQPFRKVSLPADSHRGGVLTHASVLKVTANGTTTSPVLRGVWVLEKIMGTPTPPPPPGVPAVEPDVRGAASIREMLAKHREDARCSVCHRQIDPAGFALENFDVIGGWQERYRSVDQGERVRKEVNGRGVRYKRGLPVSAADELADGRRFDDIDGFKKLLLDRPDQFVRALSEKLFVYATGGEMTFSDRPEVDRIVAAVKERNYGFRSLIHEVVQSKIFRRK